MTTLLIIAIFVFMLASAFFSACETVIVSASRAKLQQRLNNKEKGVERTLKLMERMEMVLGTILFGNNLMNVTATTLASLVVSEMLIGRGLGREWENLLNMVIMTPLILVVSELTPKAIGRLHADGMILYIAPILHFFQRIFYPLVITTSWFGRKCAHLFGGGLEEQGQVTREDLQAMAIAAADHGIVEETAGAMIRTVFELDQRPLSSVMMPLVDVVAIPEEASIAELAEAATQSGFSRFPVCRGRIDEIVGIVNLRQVIFGIAEQWNAQSHELLQQPIKPFIDTNLLHVPESKSVSSLLNDLRYHEQPMAIVVDEHGGVTGIVTTEDLVEELVGEIRDERDKETDKLVKVAESVYDCDGKLEIRDLTAQLNIDVENYGFETVAGLVLKLAGRIPVPGERFSYRNYEIEVLNVEGRRISKLRFRKQD